MKSNQNNNSDMEGNSPDSEKPPSRLPHPSRPWRVAVIANLKGESALPNEGPEDAGAEFDKRETIQSIQDAIETDGHSTVFLPANASLPEALAELCPDICFNIAEGLGGDAREAQVPALLELMHIPYTGSRITANAIGLDKTLTKRVWQQVGLPTGGFQEFASMDEALDAKLVFPLFVKPAREGTGMGMGAESIVRDEDELRRRVDWVLQKYRQPALVEEYLTGREFTVAVLGRKAAFPYSRLPHRYDRDGFFRMPVLEVDSQVSPTPGVYGHLAKTLHPGDDGYPNFLCPAPIEPQLARQLQDLAIQAHRAIGALDVSRVDLRMGADQQPKLLEINTLPGLTPGFSDLCVISEAADISYEALILEILYLGASRYGLVEPAGSDPIAIPLARFSRK
ncbi:MAG: hypothetical protein HPY76_08945 [Anaerolineae bacterium]|nr:hypothetical protein [Anaerolineae bacterium]